MKNIKKAIKSASMYFAMDSYTNLFRDCESLEDVTFDNIDNPDTIEEIDGIFKDCSSLKNADMSNIEINGKKCLDETFKNCSSLENIDLSSWDTSSVKRSKDMFLNVPEISNTGWNYDGMNYTNWNITEEESSYSHVFPWNREPLVITALENTSAVSTVLPTFTSVSSASLEPSTDEAIYIIIKKDNTVTNDVSTLLNTVKEIRILYDADKYSKISFTNLSSIKSVNNLIVTENWSDMSDVFSGCTSIETIDTSKWNTSNVTNMSSLFRNCKKLKNLSVAGLTTDKVTNMSGMFYSCFLLESLKTDAWNTSSVTNMSYMFYDCYSLISLELDSFNTSNVTNMSYMFAGNTKTMSLGEIKGIDLFDTSKVTNTNYMFYKCANLTLLDLSTWRTSLITSSSNMFTSCSVDCIGYYGPTIWKLPTSGTGFDITWLCPYNVYTIDFSLDSSSNTIELYNSCNLNKVLTFWGDGTFDSSSTHTYDTSSTKVFTLYTKLFHTKLAPNVLYTIAENSSSDPIGSHVPSLIGVKSNEVEFTFTLNNGTVTTDATTPMREVKQVGMLYDESKLKNISFQDLYLIESIDTLEVSNINDMSNMFNNCTSLKTINTYGMDTSSTSNMEYMFYGCYSLEKLDLSTWDVSKVYNTKYMFYDCSSLTSLDLSTWNTSNISSSSNMFYNISVMPNEWGYDEENPESYKYFNIKESNTNFTGYYPWNCYSLEYTVTPSNYDYVEGSLPSVILSLNENGTYNDLTSVTNLNVLVTLKDGSLSNNIESIELSDVLSIKVYYTKDAKGVTFFNTKISELLDINTTNFTTMYEMFYNSDLVELDTRKFRNWDTSNVLSTSRMFYQCNNITHLDITGTDTSKVIDMNNMFGECHRLMIINGIENSSFMSNSVRNISYMFSDCESLISLNLNSWNLENVTNLECLFRNCLGLRSINLSSWNMNSLKEKNISSMMQNASTNMDWNYSGANYTNWGILESDVNYPGVFPWNYRYVEYTITNDSTELLNYKYGDFYIYLPTFYSEGSSSMKIPSENDITVTLINTAEITGTGVYETPVNEISKIKVRYSKNTYNLRFEGHQTTRNKLEQILSIDTTNIRSMKRMFKACNVDNVDFSLLNTSNVEDMSSMFIYSNLDSSLDFLNNFDLSKVKDINCMFKDCQLREAILPNSFKNAKVTDASHLFEECAYLKTVDISNLNTSYIDDYDLSYDKYEGHISCMFKDCTRLKTVIGIDKLDLTNIRYLSSLFEDTAIVEIDVSCLDISNIDDIGSMFKDCKKLKKVTANWDFNERVINIGAVFWGCNSLTEIIGYEDWNCGLCGLNYAFANCYRLKSVDLSKWPDKLEIRFSNTYGVSVAGLFSSSYNLTSVKFPNWSRETTAKINSVQSLFYGCSSLMTTTNISHWNTVNVRSLTQLFYNSAFTLEQMQEMVGNWDVSNVTSIGHMCNSCDNLTHFEMPNWVMPKLTNMYCTFYGSKNLSSVNFDNIDLSKVTTMEMCFQDCSALESIDLSNKDLSSLEKLDYAFGNCTSLAEIKLPALNSLTTAQYFIRYGGAKTLDITINSSSLTSAQYMFRYCTSENIKFSTNAPLKNMSSMFRDCTTLKNVDLTGINTSNVTNISYIFNNCSALESVDLSTWNTSNMTSRSSAFYSVPATIDWNYDGSNYANWTLTENNISFSGKFPWNS